jgi:hypothetical protein
MAGGINFLAVGEKTKKSGRIINSSPARPQDTNGPRLLSNSAFPHPFPDGSTEGNEVLFQLTCYVVSHEVRTSALR